MRIAGAALAVSLAAVLSGTAFGGDPPKKKGGKPPAAAADEDPGAVVAGEIGAALDARVASLDAPLGGFNGSAFVAKDGKVLLDKGYGISDASTGRKIRSDSLWDWASVTKQFTATALLRLEMKKKLSVDDPLERHFKGCPKEKAKITLRQLLNHTSGIESGFRNEWKFDASSRDSLVQCVLGRPLVSKPGEKWEYSNSSYALATAVLEQATGKSWEEYLVEECFRPFGMKDACAIGWKTLDLDRVPRQERGTKPCFPYGPVLNWGYRGCGGVVATPREMWLWDRALRADKLLGPAQKKKLYEPALNDYALGWMVKKDGLGPFVEHSGGVGTNVTWYRRYLETDLVVALAFNYPTKENPGAVVDALAASVRNAD